MMDGTQSVEEVAASVVGIMRKNHADVDAFHADIIDLALSTGRSISSTVDEDITRQLKAALQFLYAVADASSPAPKSDDGNANPDEDGGFLT